MNIKNPKKVIVINMNKTVKNTFLRRELKYMIDRPSAVRLKELMESRLVPDIYGVTKVSSLYLDTPDMLLIRRSVSRPIFKEKLRLRSYGMVCADSPVFAEIKRKYSSTVSKRRTEMTENDALLLINGMRAPKTQIEREITYFSSLYAPLSPAVYLSYIREAYNSADGTLRITFDNDIRYRTEDLTLTSNGGIRLLDSELILMEIKSDRAIPLWLTEHLSREKIYCTPFSKYGAAYRSIIKAQNKGVYTNEYAPTV